MPPKARVADDELALQLQLAFEAPRPRRGAATSSVSSFHPVDTSEPPPPFQPSNGTPPLPREDNDARLAVALQAAFNAPERSTRRAAAAPPPPPPPPRGPSSVAADADQPGPTSPTVAAGSKRSRLAAASPAPRPPPPPALRPPYQPEYEKGRLVWARLPRLAVRWPGRLFMLKHCLQREELALHRPPLGRLVALLGDSTFAWVCDEDLQPLECEDQEAHLAALLRFGQRQKGRAGAQALKALRLLRAEEEGEHFAPPWDSDSDSEADEAATIADAAEAAAAGATEAGRAADASAKDKKGLTPDWVVDAACDIFGLERPTLRCPLIRSLCDPCCNDKAAPNIPAEILYDRRDDGLSLKCQWRGFVLLNPPYTAVDQWRFINRAINEVEWGRVPGLLLICRNSTDTAYFQRLRPFPRCLLRRDAIRFKDYISTPPAFGIVAFLLSAAPQRADFNRRFCQVFASKGELNMPIDSSFVQSAEFSALSARLQAETRLAFRDSWVLCEACAKWRALPAGADPDALLEARWSCEAAYPELGCDAPLSKREARAFFYSAAEAGGSGKRRLADAAAAEDQFPVARPDDMHASHSRRVALAAGVLAGPAPRPAAADADGAEEGAEAEAAPGSEFAALCDYERQRFFRVAANRERLRALLEGGGADAEAAAAQRRTEAGARCALARRLRDAAAHEAAAAARAAARLAALAADAARASAEAAAAAAAAARARDECEARAVRARETLAEAAEAVRAAAAEAPAGEGACSPAPAEAALEQAPAES